MAIPQGLQGEVLLNFLLHSCTVDFDKEKISDTGTDIPVTRYITVHKIHHSCSDLFPKTIPRLPSSVVASKTTEEFKDLQELRYMGKSCSWDQRFANAFSLFC